MQLFAVHDACASHWRLGPLPPPVGRIAVVGWAADSRAEESEDLLSSVAVPLAAALVACARVTFLGDVDEAPLTGAWAARGSDLVREIPRTDWREWVESAAERLGFPTRLALVCSRRAAAVSAAFDSEAAPWWGQGQILLLSEPNAAPPSIERIDLRALCSDAWTTHVTALGPGIFGAVRPGVDGDVAGVFTLDDARERAILDALREAARAAGCVWGICEDEADFAARLAGP
jgi:hypothetical protein